MLASRGKISVEAASGRDKIKCELHNHSLGFSRVAMPDRQWLDGYSAAGGLLVVRRQIGRYGDFIANS